MMFAERGIVHVGGDQGVAVRRLLDWYAANERRHFSGDFIQAAEHDVLTGGLDAGALQEIAQSRAGETGRPNCSFLPLNAWNMRLLEAASVAGAFERIDYRMLFDLG